MDLPYSQQQEARRKNRSAANLQHLSLAPLSTRLPLRGDDLDGARVTESHESLENQAYFAINASSGLRRVPSYLQGRSAPTTPRLLSKSPPASARSRSATGKGGRHALPKSRSTTHLANGESDSVSRAMADGSGAASAGHARHHRRRKTADHGSGAAGSGDWLYRAAVLVSAEARESKGQSWLTTRASSTSLSGLRDATEDLDAALFARELARERIYLERVASNSSRHASRHASRQASRRGSLEHHDVLSPRPASHAGSKANSRATSRATSRAGSRAGSRVQLFTPIDHHALGHSHSHSLSHAHGPGYFDLEAEIAEIAEDDEDDKEGALDGPDFVNLDEKLEAIHQGQRDTSAADEDHVRRLVKRGKAGGVVGSWLGVLGWPFAAAGPDSTDDEEDEEDEDEDDEPAKQAKLGWNNQQGPAWAASTGAKVKKTRFEGDDGVEGSRVRVPPPPAADEGTWQDAAWLLSVASKVIL